MLENLLGVETLHVKLDCGYKLPKAKAITHHGKTLKSLSVTSPVVDTILNYDLADFTDICTSCPKLTQLSVAFPSTSVDSPDLSPDFATYMVRVEAVGLI